MKLQSISLRNIRCYEEVDLGFSGGVTVVMGRNGSGKSSLLEACFTGLYGSKAGDSVLADVITNGEDRGSITLEFTHGGDHYRVEQEFRVIDMEGDRAKTTKAVLTVNGDQHYEGVRSVREQIIRSLRMDEEAFVNCAYVRQGEVNKLINASPGERQQMIDELLQLGRLEEYRERAVEARRGVGRVLDQVAAEEKVTRQEIEDLDEKNLRREAREARRREQQIKSEINDLQETRDKALERQRQIEERLERVDQEMEKRQALEEELQGINREIQRLEDEIKSERERRTGLLEEKKEMENKVEGAGDVETRLENARDREKELREALADKASQITGLEERLQARQESAREKQEQLDDHRNELDKVKETLANVEPRIDEKREQIAEARSQIRDLEEKVGDGPDLEEVEEEARRIREKVMDVRANLRSLRDSIEKQQGLMEEGRCPTCGQDLEGSPVEKTLEEERGRTDELEEQEAFLADELEAAREQVERARAREELRGKIQSLEDNIESYQEVLDTLGERQTSLQEKKKQVEERIRVGDKRLGELRGEVDDLEARLTEAQREEEALENDLKKIREEIGELEELSEALKRARELEREAGEAGREIERLHELADARREVYADKKRELDEVQRELESFDKEGLREDRDKMQRVLENIDGEIGRRDDDLGRIRGRIGKVEGELSRLEDLRGRLENIVVRRDYLDGVYGEAEALEEMYEDLRAELRGRNVDALGSLLNEIFNLVYLNDSYSEIELDRDYELTVYQKDGTPLHPRLLSGGERALFNLSLRCAIYRLLAGGPEAEEDGLPPLILDEPTVFLDRGHVGQLLRLIETMRDLGVEQILVVSHDEALIDAADRLVEVEKDPVTNRSQVLG